MLDRIFGEMNEDEANEVADDDPMAIPTKLGDDGDVHIPQWIRNAADPLGLGLLPSDDFINNKLQSKDALQDILDITP